MPEVYHFALNSSILSGTFEDLIIHAPSRRFSAGRAGVVQALFANSAVLQKCLPRFETRMYFHISLRP